MFELIVSNKTIWDLERERDGDKFDYEAENVVKYHLL
jgi:hypothetical protein